MAIVPGPLLEGRLYAPRICVGERPAGPAVANICFRCTVVWALGPPRLSGAAAAIPDKPNSITIVINPTTKKRFILHPLTFYYIKAGV
jgi:hypothetical protein